MKFKVSDNVIVLTGKDKGKTGALTRILKKEGRVVVEGLNKQVRHVKKKNGETGERVEFFAPMDISNIAIVDPKTKKASRIGYKIEDGVKTRIAKKSGTPLPVNKKTAAKVATPKKATK
jgi:large subunit ribosomal protein L24